MHTHASPLAIENLAASKLVSFRFESDAPIASPLAGTPTTPTMRVRRLCAAALRAWRQSGDKTRARWFRRHIYSISYPFKKSDTAEMQARRHATEKRGLPAPEWTLR